MHLYKNELLVHFSSISSFVLPCNTNTHFNVIVNRSYEVFNAAFFSSCSQFEWDVNWMRQKGLNEIKKNNNNTLRIHQLSGCNGLCRLSKCMLLNTERIVSIFVFGSFKIRLRFKWMSYYREHRGVNQAIENVFALGKIVRGTLWNNYFDIVHWPNSISFWHYTSTWIYPSIIYYPSKIYNSCIIS